MRCMHDPVLARLATASPKSATAYVEPLDRGIFEDTVLVVRQWELLNLICAVRQILQ